MGLFDLPKVCILVLAGYLGTEVAATYQAVPQDRVLRAATRRSDLFRRDTRIQRRFDANLAYIESENGWQSHEIFASQVRVESEAPILNLEDIEHHLNDVQCSESAMKLKFVSTVSARDAKHACSHKDGGFIITSHSSCNEEGERSVYKINEINLSDDGFSLELSVVEAEFKKAFSRFDIDFGYTTEGHLLRHHSNFQKVRRQVQSSSVAASATSSGISATRIASGSVSSTITPAPVPIPSNTTDDKTSASFNLAFQTLNSTFSTPELLGEVVNVPQIPLKVGCKNCTTTGYILLTQGKFEIDITQTDLIPDFINGEDNRNILSVITAGEVTLQANSMTAHIELNAVPTQSGAFNFPLFELPVVGFAIPKLGKAGVSFAAEIAASYEVTGGVELTYGFDLWVPTNSKLTISMTDFSKSNIVGFDGIQLTTLPFTANLTDIELKLGLGFRPAVPVGFDFLDGGLKAEVEVFMDLPKFSATLSTKKDGVDAECNALPGASNSTTNSTSPTLTSNSTYLPASAIPSLISDIGPLVLIEASVDLALGVGAEFSIPGPAGELATAANIFEKSFPLPTACLAAKEKFQPAKKVLEQKTSSYIASVSAASAAAEASKSAAGGGGGAANPTATDGTGKAKESVPAGGNNAARYAPTLQISRLGWQFSVVLLSVVAGGMILL
ncbi:hypothetical protein K469DRAFT_722749 [Zopfia rhizophila CBS 207.26]|uniref:GPI anchored protein n=1 Tax=Zopfia rhizophila CBS 207.26 TaxID=1314779 RepID=A0A6A6EWF3_9PEZI|nr:hypothetical protein K469DRAFT_722749 [Zopfia rhizophila CBS 207.26]